MRMIKIDENFYSLVGKRKKKKLQQKWFVATPLTSYS